MALSAQTAETLPFVAEHEARHGHLAHADLGWLASLREHAISRYQAEGLPTRKTEAWKYTRVDPIVEVRYAEPPAVVPAPDPADLPTVHGDAADRVVLVNGHFSADLSRIGPLPAGVILGGLDQLIGQEADAIAARLGRLAAVDGRPFLSLATAFVEDGFVLIVPRRVELDRPIEFVHVTRPMAESFACHPRVLIDLGDNAHARVTEIFAGASKLASLTNVGAEVTLAAGARLDHLRLQEEGPAARHLYSTTVRVGRDATYKSFVFTTGARLSRNEVRTHLAGTGATCHVDGAYMIRGDQHCDTTSMIEHAEPHGTSNQTFKGVIDDKARGVFQGQILVRQAAQKTDGYQLNNALLLSDRAEIDSKPQLEIYADDVKCSHGATAGQLDDTALFYLRSRGIPTPEAMSLLVQAFVGEAVQLIEDEAVEDALMARVAAWVAARRAEGEDA